MSSTPIGVHGQNSEQFVPEAASILPRLQDARSPEDLEQIVQEELGLVRPSPLGTPGSQTDSLEPRSLSAPRGIVPSTSPQRRDPAIPTL
ncbi:MAG TPA: hypothetical protein VGL99_13050, partial [Chloroflexota bacterium]